MGLQKQGPAHRYYWDPAAPSRNSAQAANSAGAPTAPLGMWEPQRLQPLCQGGFSLSEGRPWGMSAFPKSFITPHRDGHSELLVTSSWPVPAPPSLLSIALTQPAGLGHNASKKEPHWFDSPLGNKTPLQPRKHDLQRMTEGTRLFSLVKTENRHDNCIWNTWQVGGKNNLFSFPTADWTWQNQT